MESSSHSQRRKGPTRLSPATGAKQKQASVLVLRCIIANGMGNLHYCEGTIDIEEYIWTVET